MSSQGYGFPRAATSYLCQRFKVKKLFFLQINQKPCLSALCWDIGTAEDESSSSLSIGIKKVDHETLGVAHMALPADKKKTGKGLRHFLALALAFLSLRHAPELGQCLRLPRKVRADAREDPALLVAFSSII